MKLSTFLREEIAELTKVLDSTASLVDEPFSRLVEICVNSLKNGGKILFFGNGGSAADAQHLAAELVVRYRDDREPIAAISLTTDTSIITAASNDYGFEHIFSRQIEALGKSGDVAIGISTSGNSLNVLAGLQAARMKNIFSCALSGNNGGKLVGIADPLLIVPSSTTARIQEIHILLGQALCASIEESLQKK